ncbi:helix-turn-helix domain-containing protein [Streptomyces pseudogriseolus]
MLVSVGVYVLVSVLVLGCAYPPCSALDVNPPDSRLHTSVTGFFLPDLTPEPGRSVHGRRPVAIRNGKCGNVLRGGECRVRRDGGNRLLTVEEVAEWLRVSEATVRNKYRRWEIKPQKVGRLLRVRERDIANYLERHYG